MLGEASAEISPWIVIGPVAITAVVSFAVAWFTGRMTRSTERETWLREQRHAAYADLAARYGEALDLIAIAQSAHVALAAGNPALNEHAIKAMDSTARFLLAYDRMRLVGTKAARQAALPLNDALAKLRKMPPLSGSAPAANAQLPDWTRDPDDLSRETTKRSDDFLRVVIPEVGGEPTSVGER